MHYLQSSFSTLACKPQMRDLIIELNYCCHLDVMHKATLY